MKASLLLIAISFYFTTNLFGQKATKTVDIQDKMAVAYYLKLVPGPNNSSLMYNEKSLDFTLFDETLEKIWHVNFPLERGLKILKHQFIFNTSTKKLHIYSSILNGRESYVKALSLDLETGQVLHEKLFEGYENIKVSNAKKFIRLTGFKLIRKKTETQEQESLVNVLVLDNNMEVNQKIELKNFPYYGHLEERMGYVSDNGDLIMKNYGSLDCSVFVYRNGKPQEITSFKLCSDTYDGYRIKDFIRGNTFIISKSYTINKNKNIRTTIIGFDLQTGNKVLENEFEINELNKEELYSSIRAESEFKKSIKAPSKFYNYKLVDCLIDENQNLIAFISDNNLERYRYEYCEEIITYVGERYYEADEIIACSFTKSGIINWTSIIPRHHMGSTIKMTQKFVKEENKIHVLTSEKESSLANVKVYRTIDLDNGHVSAPKRAFEGINEKFDTPTILYSNGSISIIGRVGFNYKLKKTFSK